MKRFLAIGLIILLLVPACQQSVASTPTAPPLSELAGTQAVGPIIPPLPTMDANQVQLGRTVYEIHCASCHGPNLEGESDWMLRNEDGSFRAPPHDASGHTWHHSDQVLIEVIKLGGERIPAALGSSHMPAYESILTDAEIEAVLTYFKSSWPEEIRTLQWEVTVRE